LDLQFWSSTGSRQRDGKAAGIAGRVSSAALRLLGAPFPLGLRAWDGSSVRSDGPVVVLRSPRAIRHVLRCPGELGLARAYVAGDLDIDGDFREGLRRCRKYVRGIRPPAVSSWPELLAMVVRLGAFGPPPVIPAEEVRLRGWRHTPRRDRLAISHHYDVGNDFYQTILDPGMAYSCGFWTSTEDSYGLADAQRDKADLICRKLALRPGQRLLDVGCGWGSLLLHAAEQYGVHATGMTISAQQHEFIRNRVAERGLGESVEVRLQDYRDLTATDVDAVASIEMGEHVGERNYPTYCRTLRDVLRVGGRIVLQVMSRGEHAPGGGRFIESYIAPDMTMRPLPATLEHLERSGFEIRDVTSLREHYVRTIDAWAKRLDDAWEEILYRYGARRARVWRLYLAGSALAFEENRMSVHQVLAVRTPESGRSGMSGIEDWRALDRIPVPGGVR
jgi:cyclopropane-fatty-acyl-phospholipid synthase